MTIDRIEESNIRLTRTVALVGLMGLLIIATATLVDVLARWLFSAPIAGVYDLSTLFIAVTMAACFPAALASRQHIQVTFLAERLPRRLNQALDLFADTVTLTFFVLLVWQLIIYCGELIESGETSFILEVPVWPWWLVATALFVLCVPVQAMVVLLDFLRLIAGRPSSDRPGSG